MSGFNYSYESAPSLEGAIANARRAVRHGGLDAYNAVIELCEALSTSTDPLHREAERAANRADTARRGLTAALAVLDAK